MINARGLHELLFKINQSNKAKQLEDITKRILLFEAKVVKKIKKNM